jgi:periplasmic protein TonB
MSYEPNGLARDSFVHPKMRSALAVSLVAHVLLGVAFLRAGIRRSAPDWMPTSPVAISLLEHSVDRPTNVPGQEAPAPARVSPRADAPTRTPKVHGRAQRALPAATDPVPPAERQPDDIVRPEGLAEPREEASGPSGLESGVALPSSRDPGGKAGLSTVIGKPGSVAPTTAGWHPGDARWLRLREAIQRHIIYPDVARRLGWQGRTVVSFLLEPTGHANALQLLESSGFASLDASALQAVARAAPLPASTESVQIVMPIVFSLR